MCLTQAVCLNHGACVLPKVLRNVCLHCLTDMVVCVLPRHSVCAYPSWCVLPMVRVSYPWCVCLTHGAFACLTHAHGACLTHGVCVLPKVRVHVLPMPMVRVHVLPMPMVRVSYPWCVCMSYPCPWCVCLTHGACVLPKVHVSYPWCVCLTQGVCDLRDVCVFTVLYPIYPRYV